MKHKIGKLLEEYQDIHDSDYNKKNREIFSDTDSIIIDKFRGIPGPIKNNKVPYMFWIGFDIWKDIFHINIERMYKEPEYYLECWLKTKIFYSKNIDDCNYFGNLIPIWLGEGFESTFLGCRLKYSKSAEPSVDREHIIVKDNEDLKKIKLPDFENNDSMAHAVNFYNGINKLVNGSGLKAGFPDWHYGPTAMCNYLRGFEKLSLDFLTDKSMVGGLMKFVTDSRIKWSEARRKIVGSGEPEGVVISNDDVSVPNVSPDIYRELILPYEKKLNRFYGYFSYYHNCGPIDPFLEDINSIEKINMMHSGPFSDFKKVGEAFGRKSAIELHLHPDKDFINCSERDFRTRLYDIKNYYNEIEVKAYCVRLTSYSHPNISLIENIKKLQKWSSISSQVLLKNS